MTLAFPPYNLGWLGWVALVPLLLAIDRTTPKHSFFMCFAFSIISFTLIFYWVFELSAYKLIHHAVLGLYLGTSYGLFGLLFCIISRRRGFALAALTAPFIWISLEYIRSNLGFMAFPYAWIGYSQHNNSLIIQIASITGPYGVSFLLVTINSALASILLLMRYRFENNKSFSQRPISKRGAVSVIGAAILITTLSLLYGYKVISKPLNGKGTKVSVVQGNVEQAKKWDPKYAESIMQTYAHLTQEAALDHPELIVWPESATPRAISMDKKLYSRVRLIAKDAGAYLLVGSSGHQKFRVGHGQRIKFSNSAFFISPEIQTNNQQYDKIHLLPFGEYLPYKETLPWSWLDVPKVDTTLFGKELTVFQSPTFRFSAPICWEHIFPQLPRKFVLNGAQFLVNITNEAWFGRTAGPQHYLISSVFRAVENRVYVVRSANTGISCFIDPFGRVVDSVRNDANQELFVRGYLTGSVVPLTSKTFYTRRGDWLVWGCLFFSAGILAATLFLWVLRKSKRHHPQTI